MMEDFMIKEIYTKTIIMQDGTVAVSDVTQEIFRFKNEAKNKEVKQTIPEKEVAELFNVTVKSIRNMISSGVFLEGVHYKRLSSRNIVFYRKPIYEMLNLQ